MRKGRPEVRLILTSVERQRLESLAHRSRSAAALARQARIDMLTRHAIQVLRQAGDEQRDVATRGILRHGHSTAVASISSTMSG